MKIDLYHGSEKIIKAPTIDGGKFYNDYGQGFYCTQHIELAKEWAVNEDHNGYVNHYVLNLSHLNILDLNSDEYSILHWLTLLLQHRRIDLSAPIVQQGYDYLTKKYSIHIDNYDVIIGYRADDSYFSFAKAFLTNTITVEQLEKAMYLGELGEQYFLNSKKAFTNLSFKNYEFVDYNKYFPLKSARDKKARLDYQKMLSETSDGTYLIDLVRKEN